MKSIKVIHVLVLQTFIAMSAGAVAITSGSSTNAPTFMSAGLANERFLDGRVAELQHRVDRLEQALLIMAIVLVSTLAALFILSVRDHIREHTHSPHAEPPPKPATC